MKCLWIIIIALISGTFSIQTHIQRPIRYIDQKTYPGRNLDIPASVSSIFDWEHGLREATVQALFREHIGDHNLRQQIYSAPLLGKQDKATPFGDIAILARGQLYANYASYIFVQDPYQNDCDDCDTIEVEPIRTRCIKARCQIWHPRSNEQLIAIWSIKRIRHRAAKDGHDRMELEFTISPVGLRYPHQLYLTKDGAYNYGLPGHVFLLKKADLYPNLDNQQHFKEGAFIAQSPDGRKFLLHQFPGKLATEPLGYPSTKDSLSTSSTTTTQYSEEDAKKLYQKLLEALNKKTSLEPNRFTPSTRPATTLVQFPDGQVVPITEVKPPFTTKTTSTIRFPETPFSKQPIPTTTSSQAPFRPSSPLTTDSFLPTLPQFQPQTYETVGTSKKTTPHNFFTTVQQTVPYYPTQTTTNSATRPFYTVDSIQRPQYPETTQSLGTTKSPVKTTFHFFAAEEKEEPTKTVSNKKPVLSSFHQQESTTENIWFESAAPTQPSKKPTSAINEPKEENTQTTKYQDTIRPPFNKVSHPLTGTVTKVTRPVVETTYNSNTSPYHSTQTSTTIIHSNIFEPSVNSYQTTHKPSTGFSIPITVLDNTSPALDSKETFSPTEDDEQIFTAPHLTSPTVNEPTFTPTNVKYTNTQFYNPTTELPKNDITTLYKGPADFETHEPTRDSTSFESILTNSTNQGPMETTLGVTTLMTKTTGMVYYTAEETQPSSPAPTTPTRYAEFDSSSSENTKPTIIPLKMSTPKRILTTISADGTVSVKTTPFNSQEELFGPTKSSTARYKTTKSLKASTTEASDFLLDNASLEVNGPLYKKPQKDYSEDDIFGPDRGTNTRTTKKPRLVKQHTKSDFEQELFDRNNRKSKHFRSRPTTEATPSKVIYSNLFEKITAPMTTPVTTLSSNGVTPTAETSLSKLVPQPTLKTINISKRFKPATEVGRTRKEETDKTIPVTSQSYLTSISYEVNRKRKPTKTNLAKISHSNDNDIGDFAHRLVSQAKGVEYLDNVETTTAATTTTNASAKTTRKSKYTRRRTYVARTKKINRNPAGKNGNHSAQAKK
uniref:Uncharacterized protein n=1 Tax=Dendroctonus ponderosae TaxID=77166 RepID=A0AAR5QI60_DENPD